MTVDLQQRELLAQFVLVAVVRVNVDRLSKKKRFIESVELLTDRLLASLNLIHVATDLSFSLLPRAEDVLFHEPHETRVGLQFLQLVDEQAFELRLGDIHHAALPPAVVVRVATVATLRPACGQRPAARLAANEPLQREVRPASLVRDGRLHASFDDRLHAIERLFADERVEISTPRDTEFRGVNKTGIQPVREHATEALWVQRPPGSRTKPQPRDLVEHLFFGKATGREFFKRSLHQLAALWICDQALAGPLRCVQIPEGRHERPATLFERRSHAGTRPFRAHVVIELRERCQDALHQLAGGRVVDGLCG